MKLSLIKFLPEILFFKSSISKHQIILIFFNAVSILEGWPSLWVPHLSLCYGDELPKSFDQGELNELIPITLSFDTLSLFKTGPKVSEWKEITTLRLN